MRVRRALARGRADVVPHRELECSARVGSSCQSLISPRAPEEQMPSVVATDRGALEFRVGSSFGSEEAWALHCALEDAEPGRRIDVDFREVREFDPAALSLLAQDIRADKSRIGLRGVSRHLVRVLRYLGVDPGPRGRSGDVG
jgi:hypothetical protein